MNVRVIKRRRNKNGRLISAVGKAVANHTDVFFSQIEVPGVNSIGLTN